MARTKKDVYERIADKEAEITKLKEQIKIKEQELTDLNRECDEYEMRLMFKTARENNIPVSEIIDLINTKKYMKKK